MPTPNPNIKVHVTMLGRFAVEINGIVLTDEINRSLKLWNVLAYLICHRNRNVPQTELMDQFWSEDRSANPTSALKTLVYRIRTMLEPYFGSEIEPILSSRGAYSWNSSLICTVDAEEFQLLCRQCSDGSLTGEALLTACRRADALFRGPFLPKLFDQFWVASLATHYRNLYLSNAKRLAALLEAEDEFGEMGQVCARAIRQDPMDEEIHILMVRSLLRQGRNTAALDHYNSATDALYRTLGVRPGQELRELYREIMDIEQGLETDLGVIQGDLAEASARPGAFFCEYGFFKETYRLEARRAQRSGDCAHVALVTITRPDGSPPPLPVLNAAMEQLLNALLSNLRRGDVISKYSPAQYVIMLPSTDFDSSTMVIQRILDAFHQSHRSHALQFPYKIQPLGMGTLP